MEKICVEQKKSRSWKLSLSLQHSEDNRTLVLVFVREECADQGQNAIQILCI
jgi:hypothetical protein